MPPSLSLPQSSTLGAHHEVIHSHHLLLSNRTPLPSIIGSEEEAEEIFAATMSVTGRSDSSVLDRISSTGTGVSEDTEDKVFIAVKKEYKQSKYTLEWALKNNPTAKKFFLVYVHSPAQMIPMMGGMFPASQLKKDQVEAYRILEKEKINKELKEYATICRISKVQVELLVVEATNIATGLVEMVEKRGVINLVMGAAKDKLYSKKMTMLKSKTAQTVAKDVPSFCNVWFICKGNLICTSEGLEGLRKSQMSSPTTRSTMTSNPSELTSPTGQFSDRLQDYFYNMPVSFSGNSVGGETADRLSEVESGKLTPERWLNARDKLAYSEDSFRKETKGPDDSMNPGVEEVVKNSNTTDIKKDDDLQLDIACNSEEDYLRMDDLFAKLQETLSEIEHLKEEAHEESCLRRKAEIDLLEATRRARIAETNYAKEMELHKEIEEKPPASNRLINSLTMERDALKKERDALKKERDELLRELGCALREADELRQVVEGCSCHSQVFSEFSYMDLQKATRNFEASLKMGECGYGSIYKGFINSITVTIKLIEAPSSLTQSGFYEQVEALSKIRHKNLVNTIGVCAEKRAVICEYFANGTLEEYLVSKDKTPPLSCEDRIRISTEICSALVFLHLNEPDNIIHGDLRPANVLLDANRISKISNFGISRLLPSSSTTLFRWTDPQETLAYMDPEFFSSGQLTESSDTYSFGIIFLRLLTGLPALGIVKEVHSAMTNRKHQKVLDASAGPWDSQNTEQLIRLGLKCCEMSRKSRPDLATEVLSILSDMKN